MKTKAVVMTKDVGLINYTLDEEKGENIYISDSTGVLVVDRPPEGKVWFNKDNWCNVAITYEEEEDEYPGTD